MDIGSIDPSLELEIRGLYNDHLERTAKIDWSYHEFLPLQILENEILLKDPELRCRISPEIYVAVETAVLTEVNLPWFTSDLSKTFTGSLQVLQDFVHTWTSEEDQHALTLETYLLLAAHGDPKLRSRHRKQVVSAGWEFGLETPFEAIVYTTIQELATMVFYGNVARAVQPQDPGLARLLRRLAQDESLHYAFYRDVTRAHLKKHPNLVKLVADVMLKFEMPGHGMPDYEERMKTISQFAGYGPENYYTQVIDKLVRYWDIEHLEPGFGPAREAQLAILDHHSRLAKLAARSARKRGMTVEQFVANGGGAIEGPRA